MLELDDRGDRVAAHVFDRVLVAEPVRALDRVVHVPAPIVRADIAERSADPALRGNGMTAGREDLADAGGAQPLDRHSQRLPQTGAAGADDNHVVTVVDNVVSRWHAA